MKILVAGALGASGTIPNPADSFLEWNQQDIVSSGPASAPPEYTAQNVYRFNDVAGRCIDIRLGSVHSVKGQTHLATMLLSSYWHDHSARRILPCLLGENMNLNAAAGDRDRARLHKTFVAMTRPSHLFCLAIPRSALGDNILLFTRVATMIERGWHLADVVDGALSWNT